MLAIRGNFFSNLGKLTKLLYLVAFSRVEAAKIPHFLNNLSCEMSVSQIPDLLEKSIY